MTPIERAAKSFVEELRRQEPDHGGTFFVDADDTRATVIDGTFDIVAIIRAVLTAILDPGESVLDEGGTVKGCDGIEILNLRAELVWKRIIDAILAEKES